jgi:hypothetical protein
MSSISSTLDVPPVSGLFHGLQGFETENGWNVHGCAVELQHQNNREIHPDIGLIVSGPAGSGKSTLCHNLCTMGFAGESAKWIADDRLIISPFAEGRLNLSSPKNLQGMAAGANGLPIRVHHTGCVTFYPKHMCWIELSCDRNADHLQQVIWNGVSITLLQLARRPNLDALEPLSGWTASLRSA